MEFLGGSVLLFAAVAYLILVLSPWLFLWIGFRIVRHLYHVEVALFQIRDALRKEADPVQQPQRHVANSMFGR